MIDSEEEENYQELAKEMKKVMEDADEEEADFVLEWSDDFLFDDDNDTEPEASCQVNLLYIKGKEQKS